RAGDRGRNPASPQAQRLCAPCGLCAQSSFPSPRSRVSARPIRAQAPPGAKPPSMIVIGLDPGLGCTGWGVVAKSGNRLTHVANGQVRTDPAQSLPERLVTLDRELTDVIAHHAPDVGAVEEVFVNANPQSTLKLGQARGV